MGALSNPFLEKLERLPDPWGMTASEYHCARWLGEGFTYHEIAEKLGISSKTVNTHLARALEKAGAENRTHLAVLIALNEAGVEFAS